MAQGGSGLSPRGRALLIAGWAVGVHLAYLAGSIQFTGPIDDLFWGDSIHFFEQSRALAAGRLADAGLPFHPPLTAWLLVPLWWWLPGPEAVCAAAKLLLVAINAAVYAGVYLLLHRRLPHALSICLLLPLGFGELLLSAAVNSEAPYRLLLLLLVALGWRWPLVAGALHGLACLTRAEHLPLAVLLAAGVLAFPAAARWLGFGAKGAAPGEPDTPWWRLWARPATPRRYAVLALAGLLAVLLPWGLVTAGRLADYNRRHAAELPQPLPTAVPVSFYGPLNFALAQREEEIFFSRRTLPPAPAGPVALDPTFPPHNRAIVDGYRLGWTAIAADPGRFARRSLAKLGHSLTALGSGWTWRDLPKGGPWIRRPVDLASSAGPFYLALALGLAVVGAWSLRRERRLLAVGGGLLAFRLAVNVAFFPYLRGMMIAAPFFLCLELAGAAFLLRRWARPLLVTLLLLLAAVHFPTAFTSRSYGLTGERDEAGQLIHDRTVVLRYKGG